LTKYVHLNPVTAYLVSNPVYWKWSSYKEYIKQNNGIPTICKFNDLLQIDPEYYKKTTEDMVEYERNLTKIKNLMLE
jgi:hypothetical protein